MLELEEALEILEGCAKSQKAKAAFAYLRERIYESYTPDQVEQERGEAAENGAHEAQYEMREQFRSEVRLAMHTGNNCSANFPINPWECGACALIRTLEN